ncbi:MAG: DUF4382 domain-containing protein [Vicinamibacterales bacterium]
MRRLVFAVVLVIGSGTLVTSACGDTPTSPGGRGTLNIRITDSPFSDARAFLVTFTEVSANRDDQGWKSLAFAGGASSRTCDLKKLNGAQDLLGTGALPAGHYRQIRLQISAATLYFDDPSVGPPCAPSIAAPAGRNATVVVPSGVVRLNREFDLNTDTATTILLDFDGDKSVHETGNGRFMMQPVIAVVSVQ